MHINVSDIYKDAIIFPKEEFLFDKSQGIRFYKTNELQLLDAESAGAVVTTKENIIYYPIKNESDLLKCAYYVCFGIGITLQSRMISRAVLHGNGLIINGEAVLFLASSGAGKSTLSVNIAKESKAQYLADDVIVIDNCGKHVYTGLPFVKLYPETLQMIFSNKACQISNIGENDDKVYFNVDSCLDAGKKESSYPINSIFIIEPIYDGEKHSGIEKLNKVNSIKDLIKNIKAQHTLSSTEMLDEFAILSRLSQQIPIYRLAYIHEKQSLQEQTEMIVKFINQQGK